MSAAAVGVAVGFAASILHPTTDSASSTEVRPPSQRTLVVALAHRKLIGGSGLHSAESQKERGRARPGQESKDKQCGAKESESKDRTESFNWMLTGFEDSVYNCAPF